MMSRSGFRIGRIFGIDINVDWSWLLILFLVTWNLSSVFGRLGFPRENGHTNE
jgi:hypothetical protein